MPRILVAGVGNVFRGDDAFGVEVVRLLAARSLPTGVRVIDFGIRGHDLAYALLDDYDVVILVDAVRRGRSPGTVYAIEPQTRTEVGTDMELALDAHGVNLPAVFNLVGLMGGSLPALRLVGCEPETLGSEEEGLMGLSQAVRAALKPAAELVEAIMAEVLEGAGRA